MGRLNYTNRLTPQRPPRTMLTQTQSKRIPPGTACKSALRDPVVELDITGKALGNEGFLDLANALITSLEYDGEQGKVLQLEELCLKANGLDAACLPALAHIVSLAAHDLRDLDLSDNHFFIASPEDANAWELFLRSFAQCCMLRRIDLNGSPLGSKAFEVLARVYSRESSIDLLSEDEYDNSVPNGTSSRRSTIGETESLDRCTRALSLGSVTDAHTNDQRGASTIDSKVANGRRHASKFPETLGHSALPDLSDVYLTTQGLRSVPYLVFSETEINDAGALHLSYVLSCHHHPDRLLRYVPPTKASQHLQQMEHYDNHTGCQGIIYLPNTGFSGPGFKMLELSESARSSLFDDDRPPSSPDLSRDQVRKTSNSRKFSATHAYTSTTATGARRRSGTKGELDDMTDTEAIKIELDRARSRIQGETLKDAGVQSNDLWRTTLRMLVLCRILRPLQRVQTEAPPPEEPKPIPPQPTLNLDFPTIPKPTKPFVGYLDPFAPSLTAKVVNQPSTPKSKKPLPKLKTATPSPLSLAANSPTSASPKTGMFDTKPYRSDLPGGLSEEVWARIMADCLDAHRYMSERQQQAVLRWAVDRKTLAREMESLVLCFHYPAWSLYSSMAQTNDYSNLEVNKPPPHSDLEVGYKPQHLKEDYSTLQANRPELSLYDTHKESTRPWQPSPNSSTSAPEKVNNYAPAGSDKAHRTICGVKRKTFWIVLVVSMVIIAAVIGGVVGGTVGHKHKNKSTTTQKTGPGNASQANAPQTPPSSKLLNATRIASAGWNDTQQILQQRVYLQGKDNKVWELAWNSSANVWFTSSEAVAQAKAGSPLAAAVSYQSLYTQLNLYYVNNAGELLQMNTTDYKNWDINPVRTSNGSTAKPASDSSLAATWYKYTTCADCSENAFVAYQSADDGSFQLVNASMSGNVQHRTIPGNPISGSGSTFDLQWRSTTLANLRLGYQLQSGQIASAFWNGTIDQWKASESADTTFPYVSTTLKAPLTSFNFGRGAPVAVPDYLFVLSAGNNGVAVTSWDNSDPHNTHWATPQSPPSIQRVSPLSPLAANGAGHVFAMMDGVVKEFVVGEDGVTWTVHSTQSETIQPFDQYKWDDGTHQSEVVALSWIDSHQEKTLKQMKRHMAGAG
ncbi:MAG: hypothetical protein Q9218_000298 [Villophora microphyllina]